MRSRLKALIAATHRHGVAVAAALRKHPTAARRRLLAALKTLNAGRRAQLAAMEHPHTSRIAHVSRAGIEFIKGFEGFSASQYDDGTGTLTIGYGTTSADVHPLPKRLTEPQAARLLERKLDEKYAPAVAALGLPLNQNQFDAVVSLAYNVGTGILAPSHDIGRLLRARDWSAAADSFLEYNHAGGHVMAGLTRRRKAERAMFLKPAR